jgi:type VI secretion system protein VasJ
VSDLQAIRALGQTPIPGDNPAGKSVQLDDDYTALRTEVQKLDSVSQDPVEWSFVTNTAIDILTKRSKNLLAATYLTLALFEREEYAGLAAGMALCKDLLANFWDTMDPPVARKRGRIEAFAWLSERAGKTAPNKPPSDRESLQECLTLMADLQTVLGEKLGNDAPGFGDLEREVRSHLKKLESDEKASEARKAQAAKVASGEVDDTTTPDQARQVLRKLRTSIHKISDILRRSAPADPLPYRLNRAMAWDAVDNLPPNTKGVTQLPAPPPEIAARLLDLYTKGEWTALLESAEAAFPNMPLWLDLQRWIAQAMGTLGNPYATAREAVILELVALLQRLPDLSGLTFAGGVAMASPETLAWIKDEVLVRRTSVGGSGGSVAEGASAALLEAAADARKMAGRGQFPEAVRKMQETISATSEHRSQFLVRLELARICIESAQPSLAAPLLEELETYIQRHQLEVWEPRLCLAVYTALLTARRALLKDQRRATPDLAQKTSQLHERIARLDLATALALDGK